MAKTKRVVSKTGKVYEYDADKYKKYQSQKAYGSPELYRTKLVGKGGRKNYKNIQAYKEAIAELRDSGDISLAQATNIINKLDAQVKVAHQSGEEMTVQKYLYNIASNGYQKAIINSGYDYEDFLEQYGFDAEDWETESNWSKKGSIFTDPKTKKQYKFEFDKNYTGNLLRDAETGQIIKVVK